MLAVIPARKGSKGLPKKNIKVLNGKPLIQYTIEAAQASKQLTRIIVSSDDDDVIHLSKNFAQVEVPFKRPSQLAQDDSIVISTFFHLIDWLREKEGTEPEEFCVLQPTSPLRVSADIDGAISLFKSKNAKSVLSVYETKPAQWLHYLGEDLRITSLETGGLQNNPMLARQRQRPLYSQNGAVHVFNTANLRRTKSYYGPETFAYVMPENRSVDIDTITDFKMAEAQLKQIRQQQNK